MNCYRTTVVVKPHRSECRASPLVVRVKFVHFRLDTSMLVCGGQRDPQLQRNRRVHWLVWLRQKSRRGRVKSGGVTASEEISLILIICREMPEGYLDARSVSPLKVAAGRTDHHFFITISCSVCPYMSNPDDAGCPTAGCPSAGESTLTHFKFENAVKQRTVRQSVPIVAAFVFLLRNHHPQRLS